MTLKYLRDLTNESLINTYKHQRLYQNKWFELYEYNYKHGKRDSFVNRHLEMFTKGVKKCERILKERGIDYENIHY